jgi:hypothetical protein
MLVASNSAHAVFIFSDVSYTANSVTFTIDGDMTGYAAPTSTNQFSLGFQGDIWAGPTTGTNYTPNSWSSSVFDNRTITNNGNLYDNPTTNPYAWTWYNTGLAGATANLRTITVSWTQNWLNAAALNPIISFMWGNGNDTQIANTILAAIDPNDTPVVTQVPEPATLGFFSLALAGLGLQSRRRRKQSKA